MKSGLLLVCVAGLAASAAAAATPRAERMAPYLGYAGCWSHSSREANTEGDGFRQEGRVLISAALGGEALRFDERLRVVEATGRYEQLPKDRLFLDYLSFDPETSLFQLVSLGPDPSTNRMAPSADGKRFFRTSMFYSNSLAMPLELRETWTLVGDDRIEIRAEIGGVFAEYEETYAADLVRRNEAPDDCLTP